MFLAGLPGDRWGGESPANARGWRATWPATPERLIRRSEARISPGNSSPSGRGPRSALSGRQGVSQEPASGSLDTADYVAPDRLHDRSLPRSGPPAKRISRPFGVMGVVITETP